MEELLQPLLNKRYSIGTGKIIDYKGTLSKEVDVCIYSTTLHPPFFFSKDNKFGIYPVESVLACIEVKSILKASTLQDAYLKFKHLDMKLDFTPGMHDEYHQPVPHYFAKPEYSVFAYSLGLKDYDVSTILNMYCKLDPNWNTDPLITSICVANKGSLTFTSKGWLHMSYDLENLINEEVIWYLCAVIQGLPSKENSRGIPRIGYYLTNPSETVRFENGHPAKISWKGVPANIVNI